MDEIFPFVPLIRKLWKVLMFYRVIDTFLPLLYRKIRETFFGIKNGNRRHVPSFFHEIIKYIIYDKLLNKRKRENRITKATMISLLIVFGN